MATPELIEALGLSKEELAERVVQRAAEQLLGDLVHDEDGEPHQPPSRFAEAMRSRIKVQIDKSIEDIAARNVLPNVGSYIENLCLQETNRWGEKVAASLTFTEYLVKRAETYLTEQVDYNGKGKSETDGYGWRGTQTRITHLVHAHLHYSIETAMKAAVAEANKAIVGGIQETVRLKLNEAAAKLKVTVAA